MIACTLGLLKLMALYTVWRSRMKIDIWVCTTGNAVGLILKTEDPNYGYAKNCHSATNQLYSKTIIGKSESWKIVLQSVSFCGYSWEIA